jgi:hypothetical protein
LYPELSVGALSGDTARYEGAHHNKAWYSRARQTAMKNRTPPPMAIGEAQPADADKPTKKKQKTGSGMNITDN